MSSETFSIFVKGLNGSKEEITGLKSETTVKVLKAKVQEKLGINIEEQTLIYANEQLSDDTKTLEEIGIELASTVFMVIRLKGGYN